MTNVLDNIGLHHLAAGVPFPDSGTNNQPTLVTKLMNEIQKYESHIKMLGTPSITRQYHKSTISQ